MSGTSNVHLRFAPSPNGYLHLGHAYSALLNAKIAQNLNGNFSLRLEDIDQKRCAPHFEQALIEDLNWLGLSFPMPIRRQSEHFDVYQDALNTFIKEDLVYPAFMTRRNIIKTIEEARKNGKLWPHAPDGTPHYPHHERYRSMGKRQRLMTSGIPFSWRLNMERAQQYIADDLYFLQYDHDKTTYIKAKPELWGDIIIARNTIPTSYHLACVVDDAVQDISHVIRGQDLYHATSIHCLLQKILKLNHPQYFHHPLILDEKGEKLSKSKHHKNLKTLRQEGFTVKNLLSLLPPF
ncbi:tRNA glutamyl-Q(34) synthetase GluQRS [Bartonella tamiae]|uniref:Glutamyl/glutaminyl-tRNA synthetase class Ib catalytic domain-containing protein n=1 Tax=Bartonella tamiae Th239 TaxID=1094558 RepID=J0ZSG4_9HYPH|nr:tRNA glutamyl-Q(34) synthetase GluQRS [Bartonella tamiae]EJF91708.1 hypothetical protein ME5_00087 [Bartonella tamiae Th239]EJF92625.1 hypothetical protein MEG_01795 [Bartonella tamiae Th307]